VKTSEDLLVIPLEGNGWKPVPLLIGTFTEAQGSFSPDTRIGCPHDEVDRAQTATDQPSLRMVFHASNYIPLVRLARSPTNRMTFSLVRVVAAAGRQSAFLGTNLLDKSTAWRYGCSDRPV
jgi:hypothetical protein